MTTTIKVTSLDGEMFSLYIARPATAPKAAIVVLQEIFGVNTSIRRTCDLFAQDGYLAVAPDIFWRLESEVAMDPDLEPSMKRGIDFVMQLNEHLAIQDIQATIKKTRELLGSSSLKIGAVGFCLGGRLAYLAAARTNIDAAVGYYGVKIDSLLGEKDTIRRPLMLHMPSEDPYVDAAKQALIHDALDNHPQVTLIDYPGELHGFARELGKNRSAAAADMAAQRTNAFLKKHLDNLGL